jgi:hypothetical protein
MKIHTLTLIALCGLWPVCPAGAQQPMAKEFPGMEVSYIGVATVPLPPALTAQLKLQPGVGVLVVQVLPESPAAAAGFQENDVLTKLDDQILVNENQLTVLVRNRKPDDVVNLTYIRGGETKTAQVKIGRRALPKFGNAGGPERGVVMFSPGEPKAAIGAGQPADVLEKRLFFGGVAGREQMPMEEGPMPFSRTVVKRDGKNFELQTENGKDVFIVRDVEGSELFRGQVGLPEEREKVPQDFRIPLKEMEEIRMKVSPVPPFQVPLPGPPPVTSGAINHEGTSS